MKREQMDNLRNREGSLRVESLFSWVSRGFSPGLRLRRAERADGLECRDG